MPGASILTRRAGHFAVHYTRRTLEESMDIVCVVALVLLVLACAGLIRLCEKV